MHAIHNSSCRVEDYWIGKVSGLNWVNVIRNGFAGWSIALQIIPVGFIQFTYVVEWLLNITRMYAV